MVKEGKLHWQGDVEATGDGLVCKGDTDGRSLLADAVSVPFEAEFVAKTDSTNIRLRYGAGSVIFNWEVNQNQLRCKNDSI